ncbi:MAG TPA: phosphate uptake regulator PhoU [Methanosarcinaceae archaeon]|nr:phosphate uptake regulator PhoU [Methanosarcinaceae archaeon]
MDTRKVQITGKSTFIVTLPKRWAVDSGLAAGSMVSISYRGDGAIVVTPPGYKVSPRVKRLEYDRKIDELRRDIIGTYVIGGYQFIEICGSYIPQKVKKEIRGMCHNLIGIEVVEETDVKVVIQDLLDTDDFTLEKGFKRMSSLVYLMLDDVINVLNVKDSGLLNEIIARDDEVDRMYLLVSKQYLNRLDPNRISKKDELNIIESFYYRLAAHNIERIGDHAAKIAGHLDPAEIPDNVLIQIMELGKVSKGLVFHSVESLRHSDTDLANKVLEEKNGLGRKVSEISQSPAAPSIEIILDSFNRISDYATNIAELTIDLSQL